MKRVLLFIFLVILSVQAFAMGTLPKDQTAGQKSMDFTLEDLSGAERTLSDYKGKVVFLNFWATWCPPCRAEMPSMQRLHELLKGEDFIILAVGVDRSEKEIADFIKKNNYTFTILVDSKGSVVRKYQVTGIPTTFLIDKKGEIVRKEIGARDWADPEIIQTIKKMLK